MTCRILIIRINSYSLTAVRLPISRSVACLSETKRILAGNDGVKAITEAGCVCLRLKGCPAIGVNTWRRCSGEMSADNVSRGHPACLVAFIPARKSHPFSRRYRGLETVYERTSECIIECFTLHWTGRQGMVISQPWPFTGHGLPVVYP